jgi:hypothetical protein
MPVGSWNLCLVVTVLLLLGMRAEAEEGGSLFEPAEQTIDITIRDSTYLKTKTTPIRAELPIVIAIRNEDHIRHGFTSPMLKGLSVEGEGDGVDFYGRGIDGVHIGPGKTVRLRLIVPHQGSLSFHCDLHSDMQGELYLLEVPVA